MKSLRQYQHDALYGNVEYPGVFRALQQSQSAVVVMATGLGKTLIISKAANEWTNGNVLCLAHRIELVDQMAADLEAELGYRPVIEQGERGMSPDDMYGAGHVVVGSIQSMISPKRVKKFRDHPFGLIIIDECHRAVSPSYVRIIDQYRELDPHMRVLGVTATPNRTDGTALGLVFETVAYHRSILDGIDDGYLVDIHQKFAVVEDLDLSKVDVTKNEFGEIDFKAGDLDDLLSQEGPLHAMSRPVLDMTEDGQQAIIFTASVKHAHLWAAVLNHYRPGSAAALDGTTEKSLREKITAQFKSGELQFYLNFNLATEGFNAPATTFVVMGRPTKSLLVYTQQLGRCTRVLPGVVDGLATPEERKDAIAASDKPFATVLDFVGNSSEHQVVTATDVLGGNYDVDVRAAADEIIGNRGTKSENVQDALNKAKASLLLEEEEKKRRPFRTVLERTELQYYLADVDPFGASTGKAGKAKTSRGGATDAQVAALVNMGVQRAEAVGMNRKQAGVVLDKLRAIRCTAKQAKTLKKFGLNPADFNYSQASEQIQQIADNGWRWP